MKRNSTRDGLVYYSSALLESVGVRHAFSTRIGGVSGAPFGSLNLGNPSGPGSQDDWAKIHENYRRLQTAIGCENLARCWVHQVHGGEVARITSTFESGQKADAMISNDSHRLLAVRVADCVPILLSSDDGKTVAAVHAGWRGVIAGVLHNTISQMRFNAGALIAAIGPCIGFSAFEVGPEVLAEFERAFGAAALIRRNESGKGQVDLRSAVVLQLKGAGLPEHQIDVADACTYRDSGEFFSHRRDNGVTGRMAAMIASR